jgi:hypothetical protein
MSQQHKKLGELWRLDHDSYDLWEVVKVEEIEDGDLVTFKSKTGIGFRQVDEFSTVYPIQNCPVEFTPPPNAAFFERTYIHFSKYVQPVGVPGDDIEYFRDNRDGHMYIAAFNASKPVFQIARFVNLRPDARSRSIEQCYDDIENIYLVEGEHKVRELPFLLGWVKHWTPDSLPQEFDWEALPAVTATDADVLLAALDTKGLLRRGVHLPPTRPVTHSKGI